MRVGIITIHHATNYGAVWQAYSLAKAITNIGGEVEIIDYRPPVATRYYRRMLFKGKRFKKRVDWARVLRYYRFSQFQKHRLPLSPSVCIDTADLAGQASRYDMIVAGSDQIWCTGSGSFRGYDPNFFLQFCRDIPVKKISYAASAGNTEDFGEYTGEIRQSLLQFDALSARDSSTAKVVEKVCGRKPELVLDPVFLNKFEEFDAVGSADMAIFATTPHVFRETARKLLKQNPMKVVSLNGSCDFADINLNSVSPVEWLRRIKGARCVLTDYFHGAVAALRFGCPVAVSSPPGKTIKITNMLDQLGLMELFQEGSGPAGVAVERALADPTSFKADVFERIKGHEERSLTFLKTAMAAPVVKAQAAPLAPGEPG